jgi:hypothetical protein
MSRKTYVTYHPEADPDADCALTWREEGVPTYVPVQLKDLVPAPDQDPKDALAAVLADVARTYVTSRDLLIAIAVKCNWNINELLSIPRMNLLEVWLFGPLGGIEWNVMGDLRRSKIIEHRYTLPESTCEDARLPTKL